MNKVDNICKNKEEEGQGVKHIKLFNITLLVK